MPSFPPSLLLIFEAAVDYADPNRDMAAVDQKINIGFIEDVEPRDVEPRDVKTGDVLVDAGGAIQRLPVPSDDPNDPLNFSVWEKMGVIVSCCWFCRYLRELLNMIHTDQW